MPNSFTKLLEINSLNQFNFIDQVQNLRRISYVLEANIPLSPLDKDSDKKKLNHHKRVEDDFSVKNYMLAFMSNYFQGTRESMGNYRGTLLHLYELHDKQICTKRYEIFKQLNRMSMATRGDVTQHLLKVILLIERFYMLNFTMDSYSQMVLIHRHLQIHSFNSLLF